MEVHNLDSLSSFLLKIHKFDYYTLTHGLIIFMSFHTGVSITSCPFISIPIMLGVKLDVNWCSDNLCEILVNQLS